MSDQISKVCIVGGGSAGFMTAVGLRTLLPDIHVTLICAPDIPVIGVGESTTAYVPKFLHDILGIDRHEFLEHVQPSIKLGIRFEWGAPEDSHFNYAFEDMMTFEGASLPKSGAYYCINDWTDGGHMSALMDRNLAPCVPTPQGYAMRPGPAYHIDNVRFLAYLRKRAEALGVNIVSGKVSGAAQEETGNLKHLQLEDGRQIEGDLFFDCSGFRSMLLSRYFNEEYVSYKGALWCDRALVGDWQHTDTILPYTLAETMKNGWCWRIDFAERVNRGYVFCSDFCNTDQAEEEFRATNPQLEGDLKLIEFPSGRLENYWVQNVIAIGNSAAFVEPLESSALHMASETVAVVCRVLRELDRRIEPEVVSVLNTIYRRKWDDIRDFLALHYRFNNKVDSPFWQHCREKTELGNAQAVVDMYQAAGPTTACAEFIPDESIFKLNGYFVHLIGLRIPSRFPLNLDEQQMAPWRAWQERVRNDVAHAIPMREALQSALSARLQEQITTPPQ